MKYISWAAFYEGASDALYLDVLLPRVIRDMAAREGADLIEVPDTAAVKLGMKGRTVEKVAEEACSFQDAFHVVFIHADTGGRVLEEGLPQRSDAYCREMLALCGWPGDRCITITPRHETEAWLIADGNAVTDALGYNGDPEEVGLLPNARAAERHIDPKAILRDAVATITGRHRRDSIANIYPAIAQRQRLDLLRNSLSFAQFENRLRTCLKTLGCIKY